MRIVLLSWEFPPRVVGQLGEYVRELAVRLVKENMEAHVVTYHDYWTGTLQETDGSFTTRVTNPVRTHIGVLTWVLTLNQEVERVTANIYYDARRHVDLIDAHDWHFLPAAVTLKKAFDLPFVYSVDSLEEHRSHGANSPFNMAIKSIEWLGMFEAAKLVVKSDWMCDEVNRIYRVPIEKIEVISPKTSEWIKSTIQIYKIVAEGAHA